MVEVVVVGIGGATRAGKSTLARALQTKFPGSGLVHADRFWKMEKPYEASVKMENWEVPASVDYETLALFLKKEIEATKLRNASLPAGTQVYVFVEGFLLFGSELSNAFLTKRFFLTIGKRTCFVRRMTTKPVPTDYFEKLLWPGFVANNTAILQRDDICILNGEDAPENILQLVVSALAGEDVEQAREQHALNLKNDLNLDKEYLRYDKFGDMLVDTVPQPSTNAASSASSTGRKGTPSNSHCSLA